MVRRFTIAFAVFLSFCFLVALLSVPGLHLAQSSLKPTSFLVFISIWVSVVALSSLLASAIALRRIWFFAGKGESVSLEVLQQQLMAINKMSCPVWVQQKGRTFLITWRYDQTQWCELISRLGISRIYELRCRFDAKTRTVTLIDRSRPVDFIVCPDTIKRGRSRPVFPILGFRMRRLTTVAWYATAEPFEYSFRPKEIKSPVMGSILNAGWHVRFSLF